MSDPMTEGAKTGTPTPAFFIESAKKWLESLGPLSDGEVCGKLADLLAENYHAKHELSAKHTALTEALKVAGDALEGIKWTAGSQGDARTLSSALLSVQRRAIDALAALERIRNQSKA